MVVLCLVLCGWVVLFAFRARYWRQRWLHACRINDSLVDDLVKARTDATRYWRDREAVKRDVRQSYDHAVDIAIFNLDRIAVGSTPEHYVFDHNEISEMARTSSELLQQARALAAYDPSDAPPATRLPE